MTTNQMSPSTVQPHSVFAKIVHWSFILFFIYAISKGLDGVEQLADPALLRFEMVFASIFLLILISRFLFMRFTRPTALPDNTPKPVKLAARAGHFAMYISVGTIAATGLLIGALYANGGTEGATMDIVIGLHEFALLASYVFIGLHIAAAVFHRFKGDGIWSSMVPVLKEKPKV